MDEDYSERPVDDNDIPDEALGGCPMCSALCKALEGKDRLIAGLDKLIKAQDAALKAAWSW
jgi:hypothetical protein